MLTNFFPKRSKVNPTQPVQSAVSDGKRLFKESRAILLEHKPYIGQISDNLNKRRIFDKVFPEVSGRLSQIPYVLEKRGDGRFASTRPDLFLLGAEFNDVDIAFNQYNGGWDSSNPWSLIVPTFSGFELNDFNIRFEQVISASNEGLCGVRSSYHHPFSGFTKHNLINKSQSILHSPEISKQFYLALKESVNNCPREILAFDQVSNLLDVLDSEDFDTGLSSLFFPFSYNSIKEDLKDVKSRKKAYLNEVMGKVAKPLVNFHKKLKAGKYDQ